jgi:hypothetical protein
MKIVERNWKIIGRLLLLLTLVFPGCRSFDENEEAAVISAYLNNVYIKRHFSDDRFADKPFSMIVLSDQSAGFHHPFSYEEKIDQLATKPDEDTIRSFMTRNDAGHPKSSLSASAMKVIGRYPLNEQLKFQLPHILLSDKEIDRIFNSGGWDEFYSQYPNSRGIVWISRVGFNKKKTQALFYFGNQYTDSAGEGYLILLTKAGGAWKEQTHVTVWIS